ncbi:MAG: signal peptidase I [Acinetobacter sp.]|nr:signal peptidase I [Acinetobacter sp.]
MDFDFNLILVPATLIFFGLWLLDKLVLKQRAQLGKGNETFLIRWAYDFWPVLAVVLFLRSFLYEPFNIPSESMNPGLQVGDFVLVNKFDYGVRLPLVHTKILDTGSPARGDVAVFRFPADPSVNFIKRVIALPGDHVRIENGQISVNGQVFAQTETTAQKITFKISNTENVDLDAKRFQERIGDKQYEIQQVLPQQAGVVQQMLVEGRNAEINELAQQQRSLVSGFPTLAENGEFTVPAGHYFVMGDNRDQSDDGRFWGFVPEENLAGRAFYIWMHKAPGFNLPSFSRNGSI